MRVVRIHLWGALTLGLYPVYLNVKSPDRDGPNMHFCEHAALWNMLWVVVSAAWNAVAMIGVIVLVVMGAPEYIVFLCAAFLPSVPLIASMLLAIPVSRAWERNHQYPYPWPSAATAKEMEKKMLSFFTGIWTLLHRGYPN